MGESSYFSHQASFNVGGEINFPDFWALIKVGANPSPKFLAPHDQALKLLPKVGAPAAGLLPSIWITWISPAGGCNQTE